MFGILLWPNLGRKRTMRRGYGKSGRVSVIAHKGFSAAAPENTLSAFAKAIEVGVDAIEMDVVETRDGEPVVFHDKSLERTTNGKGSLVRKSLVQLKTLDAGFWFSPDFEGVRIPTLAEALELTRGSVWVHLEMKTHKVPRPRRPGFVRRILKVVEDTGIIDRVVFSSFNLSAIRTIKDLHSQALTARIIRPLSIRHPVEMASRWRIDFITFNRSLLSREMVSQAKAHGICSIVYTVNEQREMLKFVDMGVDGIITDHPDRLLKLLQESPSPPPRKG